MTFIDINSLENNAEIEPADLCIIGGGAAGITIANAFINSSNKIYLLESGGLEYEDQTQQLYAGKNMGERYNLETSRLRYFGGTTNHWMGLCVPLSEIDFTKRDWVPHSGWPITKSDLDGYYPLAAGTLDLRSYNFDCRAINPDKAKIFKENIDCSMWRFSPPTRFNAKYKKVLEKSKNVNVYLHANVTNIETTKNLKQVSYLDVRTLAGKKFRIKAKYYVLACGGLENPRILLLSRDQMKEGLGNQNDLVGRFFMEHPHLNGFGDLVYIDEKHPLHEYSRVKKNIVTCIVLTEDTLVREKLLNLAITLSTVEFDNSKQHPILEHLKEITYMKSDLNKLAEDTCQDRAVTKF